MNSEFTNEYSVGINEYKIVNFSNPIGLINSLHDCIGVIINRSDSKILCHLNKEKNNYDNCLNKVFDLNDIVSVDIYEGFNSGSYTIDDIRCKLDNMNISYTINDSFLQEWFTEGSIGYSYVDNSLIGLDLINGFIRKLSEEEIVSLSNKNKSKILCKNTL